MGLLHKLDDFVAAFRMAILTNRTLIDYAPTLTRKHNFAVNGVMRETDNSTSFLWKFSDFFDLYNLHFAYWIENVSSLPCFVLDKNQLKIGRGKDTGKCRHTFFSVVSHLRRHGDHDRFSGGLY